MKTIMTEGRKRYWINKIMETYAREIENASSRLEAQISIAKDAIDDEDLERFGRAKAEIDELRNKITTMYEELEVIREEYLKQTGAAV